MTGSTNYQVLSCKKARTAQAPQPFPTQPLSLLLLLLTPDSWWNYHDHLQGDPSKCGDVGERSLFSGRVWTCKQEMALLGTFSLLLTSLAFETRTKSFYRLR
jgi:hypothetical protein